MKKRNRPNISLNLSLCGERSKNAYPSLLQKVPEQSQLVSNHGLESLESLESKAVKKLDQLELSFAIHNGHFVKGAIEVSDLGKVARKDRDFYFKGINPQHLEKIRYLGQGSSSKVLLVRNRKMNKNIAVKIINIYEKSKRKQIMEEIATFYDAKCLTIVDFYGAFYCEGTINICLEYMDRGSMYEVLRTRGPIPESILASIVFQVLWALAYLRHAKRVHRDIKPHNIVCNSKGQVKLTDFGISKSLQSSIGMCTTFVGTFKYMSPERIQSSPYSYASDIWSLGLSIIECASGQYPYNDSKIRTYIDMAQTIIESPAPRLQGYSIDLEQFINCCVRKNPKERVPAEVLLKSPWLIKNGAVSLTSSTAIIQKWIT